MVKQSPILNLKTLHTLHTIKEVKYPYEQIPDLNFCKIHQEANLLGIHSNSNDPDPKKVIEICECCGKSLPDEKIPVCSSVDNSNV